MQYTNFPSDSYIVTQLFGWVHIWDHHEPAEYRLLKKNKYTVRLQMNGAVSKVNKKFISHLTRAKRTPSAAATVSVHRNV